MKKLFLVLFLIFIYPLWVNANSDELIYDYLEPDILDDINDYTLIDCLKWDDEDWMPFYSSTPYQTLKWWIEWTIEYINSNINIVWNEESASWKVFNIKVKCSANNIKNSVINLWFKWVNYNNKLLIEWIWDNWLIIQKTQFKILRWWGWVIFKNAKFLNEYNDYFKDQTDWNIHPSSNWVTIKDSFIHLNNNINIWESSTYNTAYCYDYANHYVGHSNYSNKQKIINSKIEIETNWNYDFKMPFYLKDSEINFKNNDGTWVYDITFTEEWNVNNLPKVDYSVFISNELDLWWNNLSVENDSDIWFINNKFSNFNNFNLWWGAMFFNNTFENNVDIDISSSHFLLNNVFKYTFTDTYDKYNLRKNYQNNEIWTKWIWWIFKVKNDIDFFNIDISSNKLYKEITGIDIEWLYNSIYVIFTK